MYETKPLTLSNIIIFIFLSVAWGLSFIVMVKITAAFGIFGAVTARCLAAFLILAIIVYILKEKIRFEGVFWKTAIVGATTFTGQYIGIAIGTPLTGTAIAAIFFALVPINVQFLAFLFRLETLTYLKMYGLFLGLIGVVCLVGFPTVPMSYEFAMGCLALAAATISSAIGSIYVSKNLKNVGSMNIVVLAFFWSFVISLPFAIAFPPQVNPQLIDIAYVLIAGGVMSALTYFLFFRLMAAIGPTPANSVEFSVTLVGVGFGALVLGEDLSFMQLIGGVLVLIGCALVLGFIRTSSKMHPLKSPP